MSSLGTSTFGYSVTIFNIDTTMHIFPHSWKWELEVHEYSWDFHGSIFVVGISDSVNGMSEKWLYVFFTLKLNLEQIGIPHIQEHWEAKVSLSKNVY